MKDQQVTRPLPTSPPAELLDGRAEETLDPADWAEFGDFAHRALDDILDFLQSVRTQPAWQPVPESVKRALQEPLPRQPQGIKAVYRDFRENVLPYPYGNIHPRFWGWVNGTGTPLALVADMLAAGMNSNVNAFDQSATYVEEQVISWLKELFELPEDASGLMVSGGSMANLIALTVARDRTADWDVEADGLQTPHRRLVLYGSDQTHNSVEKAARILGLGASAFRRIPAGPDFTMDVPALARSIARDKEDGHQPFCVVATAGTVDTGALDDLDALADLCNREGLWLHVDGAFGALAATSPSLRELVAGIERADSIAVDFHKWLHQPYEAGCVLIRDGKAHQSSFYAHAAYLLPLRGGVTASGPRFKDHGPQLSRGFKALKVWMSLKAEGVEKFGRLVEQNVAQAAHLVALIEESLNLELLAPVPLNVVCFRYRVRGATDSSLDELNEKILVTLQESGVAVPNSTIVGGSFALRVAITNHRTRRSDLNLLVQEILRLGGKLSGAGPTALTSERIPEEAPERTTCR